MRKRQAIASLPEINLIPLIDVMMTVLTFFVVLTMSITGQTVFELVLPQEQLQQKEQPLDSPLVIGLNADSEILINQEVLTPTALEEHVKAYLSRKPDGQIILKADQTVAYPEVDQLLQTLQLSGVQQILLAVEPQ